jgi:hypothetical protein
LILWRLLPVVATFVINVVTRLLTSLSTNSRRRLTERRCAGSK